MSRFRDVAPLLAVLAAGACHHQVYTAGPAAPVTPETADARPGPAPDRTLDDFGTGLMMEPSYRLAERPVALPVVEREFRGVWVATVGNLDWPSRRDLSAEQQQLELVRILDTAREQGLNAVIFQVRPMADALFASTLEPWSEYLTGAPGQDPGWDPLAFAIEQAHARGLELHAWFNPFRAGFVAARTTPAPHHVRRRRPDLVHRYGTYYWMDPGEPDAQRHSLNVITDVVRRYDVDAVHIDDYFYPYRERDARGRLIPFPDEASWARYGVATGLSRDDWRRANIDGFVEALYTAVRAVNPHVRVGISPFGIWRPGHPATVRGLDTYGELYADTRKWLLNGWADYYAPQLYWRTDAPQQPYVDLLDWWSEQNPHGRHIWAGNIPNNINDTERGWRAAEILEQVRLTRQHHGATGNVHFSASGLLRNAGGLGDAFRGHVYAAPALVPATPWLGSGVPPAPVVTAAPEAGMRATLLQFGNDDAQAHAVHETGPAHPPARWIVHARSDGEWQTMLLPGRHARARIEWRRGAPPDMIAVSYTDRAGVESVATVLQLESH